MAQPADLLVTSTLPQPPPEVAELPTWATKNEIKPIDLKIGDPSGCLRLLSFPVGKLASVLEEGVGFESSHHGFSGPLGEDMELHLYPLESEMYGDL